MRLTSPRTATSVILPNSRLRLLERSRLLWPAPSLPPPCVRISLPRPLYLNRLAAPLYVLILGMVSSSFGMITALQAITKGQSAFPVPPQHSVETPFVLWVMPRVRYPFSANHFSSRAPIPDHVYLPDTARRPLEPQKALHCIFSIAANMFAANVFAGNVLKPPSRGRLSQNIEMIQKQQRHGPQRWGCQVTAVLDTLSGLGYYGCHYIWNWDRCQKSQNANARRAHVTVLGSNASRSPSPRKLMASTVSKMNVPGKNHIQGSVSR